MLNFATSKDKSEKKIFEILLPIVRTLVEKCYYIVLFGVVEVLLQTPDPNKMFENLLFWNIIIFFKVLFSVLIDLPI